MRDNLTKINSLKRNGQVFHCCIIFTNKRLVREHFGVDIFRAGESEAGENNLLIQLLFGFVMGSSSKAFDMQLSRVYE